jgi:hypothetical protein
MERIRKIKELMNTIDSKEQIIVHLDSLSHFV